MNGIDKILEKYNLLNVSPKETEKQISLTTMK